MKHLAFNETVAKPIIDTNENADIGIIFVTVLKPFGLGNVHLRSIEPYDLPIIQSNFLGPREDVTTLVKGIQLARRFLQTTAFQDIGASITNARMLNCSYQIDIEINQTTNRQIEEEK